MLGRRNDEGDIGAEIETELRRRIAERVYKGPKPHLPTVRDMAAEFRTTRATINGIIRRLETDGLVTAKSRAGIYIREVDRHDRRIVHDVFGEHDLVVAGEVDENGLFERMTGTDRDVQVVAEYQTIPAPPRVAALLDLPAGTQVIERTWAYTEDGRPHQIAYSYLPLAVAAAAGLTGPEAEQKGIGTLWQLIRQGGLPIRYVHRRIEARMPSPEERKRLDIPPGTPVVDRWGAIRCADGTPVEAGVTVIPGDRVSFVVDIDLLERVVT